MLSNSKLSESDIQKFILPCSVSQKVGPAGSGQGPIPSRQEWSLMYEIFLHCDRNLCIREYNKYAHNKQISLLSFQTCRIRNLMKEQFLHAALTHILYLLWNVTQFNPLYYISSTIINWMCCIWSAWI